MTDEDSQEFLHAWKVSNATPFVGLFMSLTGMVFVRRMAAFRKLTTGLRIGVRMCVAVVPFG
jgi:hypothetical protein